MDLLQQFEMFICKDNLAIQNGLKDLLTSKINISKAMISLAIKLSKNPNSQHLTLLSERFDHEYGKPLSIFKALEVYKALPQSIGRFLNLMALDEVLICEGSYPALKEEQYFSDRENFKHLIKDLQLPPQLDDFISVNGGLVVEEKLGQFHEFDIAKKTWATLSKRAPEDWDEWAILGLKKSHQGYKLNWSVYRISCTSWEFGFLSSFFDKIATHLPLQGPSGSLDIWLECDNPIIKQSLVRLFPSGSQFGQLHVKKSYHPLASLFSCILGKGSNKVWVHLRQLGELEFAFIAQ